MRVVVVESAAKAKTINKYLGSGYTVLASYGHVRDLLAKDGAVEPDNDFNMHWDVDGKAVKVMGDITRAVKGAEKLILATDPDREGEAISWHIRQILDDKKVLKGVKVERVAFNAITKTAILDAMAHPREIDQPLVSAYLARRALDYLVGFNLSPVLWRKLPGAKSAGRVQSVVLRLICDREEEIEAFKTDEYWTIEAVLATAKKEEFTARLTAIAGTALKKLDLKTEATAVAIKTAIEGGDFKVSSIEKKATKRNPYPPFTTSTMQMDASRKLGFSAKQTMGVAQRLYEGFDIGGETTGLITYMRTDGVQIVPEAVSAIRDVISAEFGKTYTPFARDWKTKAKNAQEAHEAIRPTDPRRTPDKVRKYLEKDQAALYDLIWKRTIASQMAPAEIDRTTAEIDVKGKDGKAYGLRASGSVVTFDGFLKVYEEGHDSRVRIIDKGKDDKAEAEDDSKRLPALAQGDHLKDKLVEAEQHFTQPPPRYSEASIVKRMEELGIGRPSTFVSTVAVLIERDYVKNEKKQLIPEDKGRLVTAFLKSFFKRYVEYDFTADLEEKLDLVSDDKLDWKALLREFWTLFTATIAETKELRVTEVLDALNELLAPHVFPPREDGSDPRSCKACGDGKLSLKVGKFGAFIGCSNYPNCNFTRQFSETAKDGSEAVSETKILGDDPDTGLPVSLRSGRFGPYVQLGEAVEKEKPKRSSIPKGYAATDVDLDLALKLLNLPREVGLHPESGKPIVAGLGRFGPFLLHDGKYANLESAQDVFEVGLNRAVTVLAEKKDGKGRGQAKAEVLKALGEHPGGGGKVEVLSGKYGPYVKWGKVNATVPKNIPPADITMEQAMELIVAREAKGPGKSKGGFKKAAAKKADGEVAPKKVAAKKPTAAKKSKAKAAATEGAS